MKNKIRIKSSFCFAGRFFLLAVSGTLMGMITPQQYQNINQHGQVQLNNLVRQNNDLINERDDYFGECTQNISDTVTRIADSIQSFAEWSQNSLDIVNSYQLMTTLVIERARLVDAILITHDPQARINQVINIIREELDAINDENRNEDHIINMQFIQQNRPIDTIRICLERVNRASARANRSHQSATDNSNQTQNILAQLLLTPFTYGANAARINENTTYLANASQNLNNSITSAYRAKRCVDTARAAYNLANNLLIRMQERLPDHWQ